MRAVWRGNLAAQFGEVRLVERVELISALISSRDNRRPSCPHLPPPALPLLEGLILQLVLTCF